MNRVSKSLLLRRNFSAYCDANYGIPKVLVTGAVGQIGQELVPFLREKFGAQAVIATDVRKPTPALAEGGPFRYSDVLDYHAVSQIVVEENVTQIIHLAAILSATGERNPALALKINNRGTENMFEIANSHQLKIFVPSTIAAFGPTTPKDNTPNDCVLRPTTMYGLTKVHSELLGEYYHRKMGLDYRSLRYPGVISSKALPGGGTTDYAVEIYYEALKKQSYHCFLSKDTMLPMMYMPDLLNATYKLLCAENSTLTRRVYNLGSMSFTPEQLAASIQKQMPAFKITYPSTPDFRQAIADSWPNSIDDSLAQQDWGWKSQYDIDSMTEDVLKNLKEKFFLEGQ